MKALVPFSFAGVAISKDAEGRISLTDLWKSAGSDSAKRPVEWLRQDQTIGFLKATTRLLKVGENHLLKITKGRYGGSFAHEQVALEYAQYLSPELAVAVNQVFFERIEEEKNPDLIIDRGIATYKKHGKTENWIAERLNGKATRLAFTSTLAKHGVKGIGFRDCTNAIYTPMFGGGAGLVREKKSLPEKTNTREHMSETELAATRLAELLASENIEKRNLQGNKACEYECLRTSQIVAKSVVLALKAA